MTEPLTLRCGGRTLVVYAFHEYTRNARFFMRHGLRVDAMVDYIMVQNMPHWDENSHKIQHRSKPLGVSQLTWLNRVNRSQDWGAYSQALVHTAVADYDYFLFLNSSMRGPFIPTTYPGDHHWTSAYTDRLSNDVALVGASINYWPKAKPMPHVQSMLMVMDHRALRLFRDHDIFFDDDRVVPKHMLIQNHEIGGSALLLQHGYNMDCLLAALQNRDWRQPQTFFPFNPTYFDFWGNRQYYNYNIHPFETMFMKTNRPFDMNDTILNLMTLWYEKADGHIDGVPHTVEEWLVGEQLITEHDVSNMHQQSNRDIQTMKLMHPVHPRERQWQHERFVWLSLVICLTGAAAVLGVLLWAQRRRVA